MGDLPVGVRGSGEDPYNSGLFRSIRQDSPMEAEQLNQIDAALKGLAQRARELRGYL
jgi:hypothetical protein